jgi:hypothetical protein
MIIYINSSVFYLVLFISDEKNFFYNRNKLYIKNSDKSVLI